MSRPQKMHKPLKGGFNEILGAVALGSGRGKRAAMKLAREKPKEKYMANERPAGKQRQG